MKKTFAFLLAVAFVLSFTACASPAPAEAPASAEAPAAPATAAPEPVAPAQPNTAEPVTINLFTNLPDRTSGQGLVEQMLIDSYIAENPHVKINVEALDDESYKTKFKAYAAGSEMPDFVSGWGQPSFLDEVIDAGLLAELNPADYADYGFVEGSLSGFSKNGKLYGLARNTDVMGFFYNKAIFDEHGWTAPKSFTELVTLAGEIRKAGLQPVSTSAADGWPLNIMLTGLYAKVHGPGVMEKQLGFIANKNWNDPEMLEASRLLQDAAKAGLFANGFETADYGTAQSLFTSGQAAMYYMGSWETGMAVSQDIPEDIRSNIRVFALPAVEGGKGTVSDISAWNGGGYFVTANSKVKPEALKLLDYFFQPDHWNKLTWENNICMSAQDFSKYKTGNETPVQLEYIDIFTGANSVTGNSFNDLGTSDFKTKSEKLIVELAIGSLTPEQFLEQLSAAS